MASPEPTVPGAFPEFPDEENTPSHIFDTAKSYVLDLTEKSKPLLPQAIAKHLPESHHPQGEREIKTEPISESHDENVKVSGQETNLASSEAKILEESQQLSKDEGSASPPATEEERIMQDINAAEAAVSGSIPASQGPDDDAELSEDVIPVDPDCESRPKADDAECEETALEEEVRPSFFVSNRHLTGSGEHLESPAEGCVAHGVDLQLPGTAAPAVTAGVAEDRLLEDYLGSSSEPQAQEPANKEIMEEQNLAGPETDAHDSTKEEKTMATTNTNEEPTTLSVEASGGTTATEGSNPPENIQEKTRDNCLPPPVSVMPADDAQQERCGGAGDMGSPDDRGVEQDAGQSPARIHGSQAESGVGEKDENGRETLPPKKVGLMDKIKGEIKVVAGELQRNKEKVGKRMKGWQGK